MIINRTLNIENTKLIDDANIIEKETFRMSEISKQKDLTIHRLMHQIQCKYHVLLLALKVNF